MNIVDYLSFGSEVKNINILDKIADVLYNEPQEYKSILSDELSKGLSFPKARENALLSYLDNIEEYSNVLSCPNNILGIEYLKALKKYKSSIKPICIPRFESEYNSNDFSGTIASATAIRTLVKDKNFDTIKNLVPIDTYNILMENLKNGHIVSDLNVFEKDRKSVV